MSLVNPKKIFENAELNKSAFGAYNFTNFEQLAAIMSACEKENSDAIIAVSKSAIEYLKGVKNVVSIARGLAENYNVDFSLHLDHGKTFDICKDCIDAGFNSVMIDASDLAYEENIALTKKVVDYAHSKGVFVEAELGKLQGVEDEVSSEESVYTDPSEALDFVTKTGVDSLAISIGTSHGAYKFTGSSKLSINRLKEIKNHLPNTYLVLHGASSVDDKLLENFHLSGGELSGAKGVSDESLTEAIQHGIRKINTDTDLRIAFTTGVRNSLKSANIFDLRTYLKSGMLELENLVIEKIKKYRLK